MIEQDRAVERQRVQERCENAADFTVSALQGWMAEMELRLSAFASVPSSVSESAEGKTKAEEVLLAVFSAGALEKAAGPRLL